MTASVEVQLFGKGGALVATVAVQMKDGKYPLIVTFGGESYALVDGRYVAADVISAQPA